MEYTNSLKKVLEGKTKEFVIEYRTYSEQGNILKTVSKEHLMEEVELIRSQLRD